MSFYPVAILVFSLFLMIAYFQFLSTAARSKEKLRARLSSYARMKASNESQEPVVIERLLHSPEHDILLGILKKVEAKNASLFRAWTFVVAAAVALTTSDFSATLKEYIACFLIVCMPFLWASLRGMKQIDQFDMPRCYSGGEDLSIKMQAKLMDDLLVKEVAFNFAYRGAFLVLTISIVAFAWHIVVN